jgi:hypothetical protein
MRKQSLVLVTLVTVLTSSLVLGCGVSNPTKKSSSNTQENPAPSTDPQKTSAEDSADNATTDTQAPADAAQTPAEEKPVQPVVDSASSATATPAAEAPTVITDEEQKDICVAFNASEAAKSIKTSLMGMPFDMSTLKATVIPWIDAQQVLQSYKIIVSATFAGTKQVQKLFYSTDIHMKTAESDVATADESSKATAVSCDLK